MKVCQSFEIPGERLRAVPVHVSGPREAWASNYAFANQVRHPHRCVIECQLLERADPRTRQTGEEPCTVHRGPTTVRAVGIGRRRRPRVCTRNTSRFPRSGGFRRGWVRCRYATRHHLIGVLSRYVVVWKGVCPFWCCCFGFVIRGLKYWHCRRGDRPRDGLVVHTASRHTVRLVWPNAVTFGI